MEIMDHNAQIKSFWFQNKKQQTIYLLQDEYEIH